MVSDLYDNVACHRIDHYFLLTETQSALQLLSQDRGIALDFLDLGLLKIASPLG